MTLFAGFILMLGTDTRSPPLHVGLEESMATSEEIRFTSRDRVLAGTLHRPTGLGPHPALLMLQGSGPADRDSGGYFPLIRNRFIESGLAVLSWDKPGIGGSAGDWRQQTLFDRGDEALDALGWLREQPAIDPEQIGVWGHSQGGWIAPLVASKSDDIAFVVANSGPGVTPEAQDFYGMEHTLRLNGVSEAEIEQALTWLGRLHDAAREGMPYDELAKGILEPARDTPAFSYFGEIGPEDWPFFVLNFQHPFDPVVVLEQVNCPMLAIFGELDPLVPVTESVRVYQESVKTSGNPDLTIHVFPGADHRIRVGAPLRFAPGYFETMSGWLRQHARIE